MDIERLDELCLGAGLEVGEFVGPPEVGEVRVTRQRSKTRKDGVVSMTTQRMEEDEERWRKLFPDIRKCRITIVRPPLEQLRAWKQRGWGRHRGSRDSGRNCDWIRPRELQECDGRSKSFVKKVEVRIQAHCAPEEGPERSHCLITDSAPLHLIDHTYCVYREVPNKPDSYSQSEDIRLPSHCRHKDCSCFSAEKKNPPENQPNMEIQKVWEDHWVVRKPEEERQEEEEVQMQLRDRMMGLGGPLDSEKKKRRHGCGGCAACLRKNCGSCNYCRDMKMFGGPSRLRQKCVMRRCLVVKTRKEWTVEPQNHTQAGEETVTTATPPQLQWTRWRRWTGDAEGTERRRSVRGRWRRRMWGGKRIQMLNREEEQENRLSLKETRKRRWRRELEEQRAKISLKESENPAVNGMKKEEEEETKLHQVCQVSAGGGGASGLPNGTHLQLNLNMEDGHLSTGMQSDSTLTCLPQVASVLNVSTDLTDIPAPLPTPVQQLQVKEEAEPVKVDLGGRGLADWGVMDEHACMVGVSDKGRFYDVQVELQCCGSDEEVVTAPSPAPSDITVPVNDDIITCDITCQRPEFISLSSSLFRLFRGPDVTGGRGLRQMLQVLRKTVLPAHWVAVLAEGPVLQLLQCSRLSSMRDTIVHVGPNQNLYVSVQNLLLPDTHRLYQEHTHMVEHLSQLVSLLLDLERMTVCGGLRVRNNSSLQRSRSHACHLLLAPPLLTCLPCLLEKEDEDDEDDDEGVETEN